jgi:hypothetical protein
MIGEDQRYEWRVVVRTNDGHLAAESHPTTNRDRVLATFAAMMEEYKKWPQDAIQLERREIGRWEAVE